MSTKSPTVDMTALEDEIQVEVSPSADSSSPPEIPENVFVEFATPKPKSNMETINENPAPQNLQTLYDYLGRNLEKKGYEDALVNPDSSYMEEQVLLVRNDLTLVLSRVKTYYVGYMREIELHIETRKRNGMIETVDELESKKETIADEMKTVYSIEDDSTEGKGLSQNLILTYRVGFKNGFAAITYNKIFGR